VGNAPGFIRKEMYHTNIFSGLIYAEFHSDKAMVKVKADNFDIIPLL